MDTLRQCQTYNCGGIITEPGKLVCSTCLASLHKSYGPEWKHWESFCENCKKKVKTTQSACGCGRCMECGWRFVCRPIDISAIGLGFYNGGTTPKTIKKFKVTVTHPGDTEDEVLFDTRFLANVYIRGYTDGFHECCWAATSGIKFKVEEVDVPIGD